MENPAMNGAKWQVPQIPPGSSQVVACVKRSEKMNRFSTVGTLNSGGPECAPSAAARWPEAIGDRPKEDASRTFRESDPSIVVRDGSAGHTASHRFAGASAAKGWTGSNASTGITSGHEYSRSNGVKLPACNGDRFWHSVPEPVPRARYPEEPGAGIPHAGICEGGTG